jgi:SnoaL-like protein
MSPRLTFGIAGLPAWRARYCATERTCMHDADRLLEVESIKQLKARYCRYLDAKDWVAWRGLFTDDLVSDMADAGGPLITGADLFVAFNRKALGRSYQPTVHQVHAPEINLTSATTATGVWAFNDVVRIAPCLTLNGFGHYHETYEKTGGRWRIKTCKVTRLREDIVSPLFSVRMSQRMRSARAWLVRRSM